MRLLLPLLLLACIPKPPATPLPDPGGQAQAVARGEGALFLQGFDVRWQARPHRVSGLGFGASGVDHDGELVGRI